MKLYTCTSCGNPIYFENSTCLQCSHALGFDDSKFKMVALENNANAYIEVNNKGGLHRYCSNSVMGTCNWIIPVNSTSPFCTACQLNRTIPELNTADNQAKWKRIEVAKHRLVYSLLRLRLPVKSKQNADDVHGIAFDFMADVSAEERVMTGHDNGVITINIEEADEAERAKHKSDLGERYRTLLGHFRHEIGHYYWEILIKDGPHLEKYRQLFGDEQKDYREALQTYYANQTPANWNDAFISPYATSHSWEDWAETWAHYMHMMDTLETAWSFGINIQRPEMQISISNDPYTESYFTNIINRWYPLAFALNSLNRSMGHIDFYPFVITAPVVEKLRFIHEVCGVGKMK